ncbi:penicillin-binding transpeptidase domain-containing protein [Blautia sp. An81]|uniref:penicillin-binding transpeptidase domain-containing protein n=1 Tax=Blautia sp. An81 TaxID=1965659 RepID=UPI000B3A2C8F|nr:penicillin-binding transpeptidase domain-containing protein [Blautia sp. An81]OUN28719.1 hypothetical protein B5G33_12215 [Blautia sp. An81]
MAKKKKGKKKNQKKKILIGTLAGVVVLAVGAGAGVFLYQNVFSGSREEVLKEYMACIEAGEYEKMYDFLDSSSQETVSQEDFVTRNQNIYEGIEASDIQLDISEGQDRGQPLSYSVTMNTIAGEISYDNNTAFEREDGDWKIVWTDAMIYPSLGENDRVSVTTLEAERGSIYDRNQNLLAGQGTVQSVGLVPGKMDVQPQEEIQAIAQILGTTEDNINSSLDASWVQTDSFVPLKEMTQEQLDQPYTDADGNETGQTVQEALLSYPGVMISETESRVYPYGESTAHLLGYVQQISAEELEEMADQGYNDQSIIGKSGLESLYEERLRARDGHKISILDSEGNEKEALAMEPAQDGEDITLTIDINWQTKVYEAYQEDESCSVVMNPKTGEILALVSTPSYDSMDFVLGISQEQWDSLNNDETQPLYNRFRQTWVPGSSFKPVIAAIGLSTGTLNAEEDLGASGLSWQKDSSWGDYYVTTLHEYSGVANLRNALVYSDNIYFAKAALQIGADTLAQQLEKLGFNQDIPFDIVMTSSQYSNTEGIDTEIQLADSGYGQGQILVNPLHLACIYSAFFNEGDMIAPYLEYEEGKTASYWIEDAFTPEAAQTVYEDMQEVVSDAGGTGHAASSVAGVTLAGKTGTAEIKESQEDTEGTELGWFAVYNVGESDENTVLMLNMVEDVKGRGGSGYVVDKDVEIWNQMAVSE